MSFNNNYLHTENNHLNNSSISKTLERIRERKQHYSSITDKEKSFSSNK